jgi:hypothetical protein
MEAFEQIARAVLSVAAWHNPKGFWEGHDEILGSDEEIIARAVMEIEQGLGLTKCEECGGYEISLDSPFCKIPLCGGHFSVMVANDDGTYSEVK